MDLKKIMDWIRGNGSRINTTVILFLIVLLGLSVLRNGCDRRQIEDMAEQLADVNVRNEILEGNVEERDSCIAEKEKRISVLKNIFAASQRKLADLQVDYGHLKADYEDLSDSVSSIPVDTSYRFLITEAYPYEGHKEYPFNEPQVKGIHLTYLEKISLEGINENLGQQLDETKDQLHTKDTIVDEQDKQIALMKETRQDLDSLLTNKDKVIEIKDQQIGKERRNKTIWQTTMGVIVVILTIIAIGGG